MLLTDLADAARKAGLRVVELDGWRHNVSAGEFDPDGVLCHHTGSYDDISDAKNDLDYAKWLAFTGRSDLPPPLCGLALSAECVVYVCSAGNANHAGAARPSGPMPAASDGSAIYVGIEAMNSGSQGWDSVGHDAAGNEITQYEAYVRLCAALCRHYGWPASHVRAHWETSLTGKWDPGDPDSGAGPDGKSLDMDQFRADVARAMTEMEDPMAQWTEEELGALIEARTRKVLQAELKPLRKAVRQQAEAIRGRLRQESVDLDAVAADVDHLVELVSED